MGATRRSTCLGAEPGAEAGIDTAHSARTNRADFLAQASLGTRAGALRLCECGESGHRKPPLHQHARSRVAVIDG
jgi:hypothetical protein